MLILAVPYSLRTFVRSSRRGLRFVTRFYRSNLKDGTWNCDFAKSNPQAKKGVETFLSLDCPNTSYNIVDTQYNLFLEIIPSCALDSDCMVFNTIPNRNDLNTFGHPNLKETSIGCLNIAKQIFHVVQSAIWNIFHSRYRCCVLYPEPNNGNHIYQCNFSHYCQVFCFLFSKEFRSCYYLRKMGQSIKWK